MGASGGGGCSTTGFVVGAAERGDRQALEGLFTRYLPWGRPVVALRLGKSRHRFLESDDVGPEILFTVFQDNECGEHKSDGSFRNWIAECVECKPVDFSRNAAAKKRGGGKVRRFGDFATRSLSDFLFPGNRPTPSQVVPAREAEERLETALLNLPAHHREVIILRRLCELSSPEIARAPGFREEASARKACSRALSKRKEPMES